MSVRLGPGVKAVVRASQEADQLIVTPALTKYFNEHPDIVYDPDVIERVTERVTRASESRLARLGASSAGRCPREQILGFLGMPGHRHSQGLRMVFEDGHWRHMRLQALMLQAGIIEDIEVWGHWKAMRAAGQIDGHGYVPDDHPNPDFRGKEFGVEIKGANTWPFKRMQEHGLTPYRKQVARYFLYTGYELFVIYAEDKNCQESFEWVVSENDLVQEMDDQRAELAFLNKHLDQHMLPGKLTECQAAKGPTFRDCVYGRSTENSCHNPARNGLTKNSGAKPGAR